MISSVASRNPTYQFPRACIDHPAPIDISDREGQVSDTPRFADKGDMTGDRPTCGDLSLELLRNQGPLRILAHVALNYCPVAGRCLNLSAVCGVEVRCVQLID